MSRPRRAAGFSTALRTRPRRSADPITVWGSISAGYVVEGHGPGRIITRDADVAYRVAEVQVSR